MGSHEQAFGRRCPEVSSGLSSICPLLASWWCWTQLISLHAASKANRAHTATYFMEKGLSTSLLLVPMMSSASVSVTSSRRGSLSSLGHIHPDEG